MLYYVLFSDITSAQELYKIVKEKKIKSTLAPAPRLPDSNCCGISILYYDDKDTSVIKKIAEENGIEVFRFVSQENNFNPNRLNLWHNTP